jgi:hypothetical protein
MNIFNNTILKLVFRQGTNEDRKRIVLTSGEPGYTTDTNRLYIGNGVLSGGQLMGNLFKGFSTDITSYSTSEIGDQVFNTNNNTLYSLKTPNANNLSAWGAIGGIYSSADPYIKFNNVNGISLNSLSANSLSHDLVSGPIILSNGRISLSSNIPFNRVSTKTLTISSGLKGYIDDSGSISDITNTKVNTLSSNIILSSNQILARYDGVTGDLKFSRGVTDITKLETGLYRFIVDVPNNNFVPLVQIIGLEGFDYIARPEIQDLNICIVHIKKKNEIIEEIEDDSPEEYSYVDAEFSLVINY